MSANSDTKTHDSGGFAEQRSGSGGRLVAARAYGGERLMTGRAYGGGRMVTDRPHGGGEMFMFDAGPGPASTGGRYALAAAQDTSIDLIPSLTAETWQALWPRKVESRTSEERSLIEALAERVTGERMSALLAGAVVALTSSTPVLHKVFDDPFALTALWRQEVAVAAEEDAVARVEDDEARAADPEAFRAFKDLGRWLSVDDEQVAGMLGIGRTTAYSWKREGREPRAETARRVYEYHGVLDSLRRQLGASVFQLWLRDGTPARRDVLLSGDLQGLERDAHMVLFDRTADQRPDLAWAPERRGVAAAADSDGPAPHRAARRPRSARLT